MTKILCVEDNPQNMRLVRKILKHEGYEVIEAEDGLSGVALAKSEHPDLILMDINLPDIDGLEATQRIKAVDELQQVPVIALTANAMYGDEERILDAGCDGYLSKPVGRARLIEAIEKYLAEAAEKAAASVDTGAGDPPGAVETPEASEAERGN